MVTMLYNIRCGILIGDVLAMICSGKYCYSRRPYFRMIDTALLLFLASGYVRQPPVTVFVMWFFLCVSCMCGVLYIFSVLDGYLLSFLRWQFLMFSLLVFLCFFGVSWKLMCCVIIFTYVVFFYYFLYVLQKYSHLDPTHATGCKPPRLR
jgi:hypothetical protein